MERVRCKFNLVRLEVYEHLFEALIKGEHDETAAANLLIDIRWPEVARAFVNCVTSNSCTGTLRPLAADFGALIARAAELAFGTRTHADIPSWFFQNNECFLASCMHKLLLAYTRQPALAPHQMRKAFETLFDVADACKPYLGLGYLAQSTGAHALMSAVENARYDFLRGRECVSSAPALCFAEMLAERILLEPSSALALESPFCFFARSARWQRFATACVGSFSQDEAFARLQRLVAERRAPAEPAGLFRLASAFLEAEGKENAPASPERPKRKVGEYATPVKACRSAIGKRSRPFVSLMQRLVARSQP